MIKFLKNLFRRVERPIQVEVTVNVPAIKVFVSGRGEESNIAEDRSGTRVDEARYADSDVASEEIKLDELKNKLQGQITIPEVAFGEEKATET